jgi:hypothetical protein
MGGGNGQWWFDRLVWDMQAAWSRGLNVDIEISAGSGQGAPRFPDPYAGTSRYYNRVETTAGKDYDCGVSAIMDQVNRARTSLRAPARTVQWEAFNEPDFVLQDWSNGGGYRGTLGRTRKWPYGPCGRRLVNHKLNDCGGDIVRNTRGRNYLCGSAYAGCGALEAAELWEEAQLHARRYAGYELGALTVSSPQSAYGLQYVDQVNALYTCRPVRMYWCFGSYPRWWAVHDYDDPTAAGLAPNTTADLQAFEDMLSSHALGSPRVWVTESGVNLASRQTSDDNWKAVHCVGDEPADGRNDFGCLVDDRPAAQRRGAAAWRELGSVRAPNVVTTEVFWFEFTAIGGWDSALLDQSAPHHFLFEDQGYGSPRASFCYLTRQPACTGSADEFLGGSESERERRPSAELASRA